ncbi:ubiquitin-conjugating enzyme/RWD-like protein [Chlamydoabsidia padenii]|nr:ubiquitin-conjugating enzyme/RWD-like protein [Chlamydoabsidia padenii]
MASRTFLSRMSKELADLERDPPPHIVCYPCEGNMTQLDAYFHGPPGTPYESGLFRLGITVPETYPFDPPMIKFVTPIYHPNIDDSGRICANVLKKGKDDQWKPSMNLRTTLLSLHALMGAPNPDDPLDADIAREYQQDYDLFTKKAKEYTKRYAIDGQEKATDTSHEKVDKRNMDDNNGTITMDSTITTSDSTSSSIDMTNKPKRKSKLSLSRRKNETGSEPMTASQQTIDEVSSQSAVTRNEHSHRHQKVETSNRNQPVNNNQDNGSNDSGDIMEQQTDDNQIDGSNKKEDTVEQQTDDNQDNRSSDSGDTTEQQTGGNRIDGSSDSGDTMKQQTGGNQTTESIINNADDKEHSLEEHQQNNLGNDVEHVKEFTTQAPSLTPMMDNSMITLTTNIENISSGSLALEKASTRTFDLTSTTETSPTPFINSFTDNGALIDLSSTFNKESSPPPKRKRTKLSLSCKKKPKTV